MTTTNPVPSNDPTDLLFNAQKLDEVVSGTSQYYTDRLGASHRTVAGINAAADVVLGGLGYAPPVAYAGGILMSLTTKTVEYAGEVYAPKLANIPFTTTTWATDSAKFRLIQGVSATDLAASGGASMIGYMPAGTGAAPTNVQTELRERSVNARRYGMSAAASRATNDAALSNALNSGARQVFIPHGTYLMSAAIVIQAAALGITVVGEGKQSTILSWAIDAGTSQKFATLLDGYVGFENITLENTGNDQTNSSGLVSYTPTAGNGMHDSRFKNVRLKGWGAGVGASINGTSLTMTRSQVFACVFEDIEFTGCGKPIRLGVGVNNNVWIRPSFWDNKGNRHVYLVEGSSNLFISPQFEPVNASVTTGMLNAELVLSPNNVFLNAYFEPCYGILADSSPSTVVEAPIIEGFDFAIGTLSNNAILRSTNASNGGVYASPMVSRVSLPVSRAVSNPTSYCVSDDNISTLTLIDAKTSRDTNFKLRPSGQSSGQIPVSYRGVWQPTVAGTSGTSAHTYAQRLGWYIRIGQQVTVFFRVSLTAKDAGMAGNAKISGLPFAVTSDTLFASAPVFAEYRADLSTGYNALQGGTVAGGSEIQLTQSGDNITPIFLPAAGVLSVSAFAGQMTYITDAL